MYFKLAQGMSIHTARDWQEVCPNMGWPGKFGQDSRAKDTGCDEAVAQRWVGMWTAMGVTGSRRIQRQDKSRNLLEASATMDVLSKLAENDYFRGMFFCYFAAKIQPKDALNPICKMYWYECGRYLCEMRGPHKGGGVKRVVDLSLQRSTPVGQEPWNMAQLFRRLVSGPTGS